MRNQQIAGDNQSFHLKQIDEDGELLMLEGLGAEHESSSLDEEDEEDDFFAFDNRRGFDGIPHKARDRSPLA